MTMEERVEGVEACVSGGKSAVASGPLAGLMSAEIGELAKALSAAQAEMVDADKDGKNPHFRSTYATLAEVRRVTVPVLAKHGIATVQIPSVGGGTVRTLTVLMHHSGQWIASSLAMSIKDASPQSVGSAITYGRRYSLAAIACVAADEDDDGEAAMGRSGGSHGGQGGPGGRQEPSRGGRAASRPEPRQGAPASPVEDLRARLEAAETGEDLASVSEAIVAAKGLSRDEVVDLRKAFARRLHDLKKMARGSEPELVS